MATKPHSLVFAFHVLPFLLLLLLAPVTSNAEDEVDSNSFISQAFPGETPKMHKYWLTDKDKTVATQILGHAFGTLRVRYWAAGNKSAWILDEIGKVKPITIGVVVDQAKIREVKILAFRESRGWEVKYPFFTDQFTGVTLSEEWQLNRPIDGITGATLSVRAVTKVARLALYFAHSIKPPSPINVETHKKN